MTSIRSTLLVIVLAGAGSAQDSTPSPTPPNTAALDARSDCRREAPQGPTRAQGTLPGRVSLFPCVIGPGGESVLYVRRIKVEGKSAMVHALWEGGDDAAEILRIPRRARDKHFPRPAFSASGERFLVANRDPDKRISAYLCGRGGAARKLPRKRAHVSGLAFVGEDPIVLEVNRWTRPPGYELYRFGPTGQQVISKDPKFSADCLRLSVDRRRLLLRLQDEEGPPRLRVNRPRDGKAHRHPAFSCTFRLEGNRVGARGTERVP